MPDRSSDVPQRARRAALLIVVSVSCAIAGETQLVSVGTDGETANKYANTPAISDSGRYVVFVSTATNLVPDVTNDASDVFVRDRRKRQTTRISIDSAGGQANGPSDLPVLSGNGRFIAFVSRATNLVERDTNGSQDIFVHDRRKRSTERVSLPALGLQAQGDCYAPTISRTGRFVAFTSRANALVGDVDDETGNVFVRDVKKRTTTRISRGIYLERANGGSFEPSISGNGRYVAFTSSADNLVEGDTNNLSDVFVHDVRTGTTTRVSVGVDGEQGNGHSNDVHISANGRMIAFTSSASNLVPGDDNGRTDVFVHDRKRGTTTRVSVSRSGAAPAGGSYYPSISANGRAVSFYSEAPDLVDGDTNGQDDVFVRDLGKRRTTLVSVASDGTQANAFTDESAISGNGRFIAFSGIASNLVPEDTLGTTAVFLHDRK